ncbi:MAG: guanylate kinase [Eubacteriales bacterium]|nr:guanylate kinase [Eubacteriales bacterium]
MGKIFYIMGKSASGKDKIYSRLLKEKSLCLQKLILYTTRPIREGEENGKQYFFVDDSRLREFQETNRLIEARAYQTVHGVWTYFTADDGQMNLEESDYLGIGTLESYMKMKEYYGEDRIRPIYIEVEDGERLTRALLREKKQTSPKYAEMCRRYLADEADFSEENIRRAGITRRFVNGDLELCVEEITGYIRCENSPGSICSE